MKLGVYRYDRQGFAQGPIGHIEIPDGYALTVGGTVTIEGVRFEVLTFWQGARGVQTGLVPLYYYSESTLAELMGQPA